MQMDQAFMVLHGDLPRQGVGTDWCTREAIRRLPPLRKPPAIIDLGCGPGRQTILLAMHFQTEIQAVDRNPHFLHQLRESAESADLGPFIKTRQDDFTALSDSPGSYDLIWSEGSAWVMGMQRSLEAWAPLLRQRGVLAVSECTWMHERAPTEVRAYWDAAYPEMNDFEGNVAHARKAGLKVFDHFVLPRNAWWDDYYTPLTRRIAALKEQAVHDPALEALIEETETEIAMFQRWGSSYAYIFYLMRPA